MACDYLGGFSSMVVSIARERMKRLLKRSRLVLLGIVLSLFATPAVSDDDLSRAAELSSRLWEPFDRSQMLTIREGMPEIHVNTPGFEFRARRMTENACRLDWVFRSSRRYEDRPFMSSADFGCDGLFLTILNNETGQTLSDEEIEELAPEIVEALHVSSGFLAASIQYSTGRAFGDVSSSISDLEYLSRISRALERLRESAFEVVRSDGSALFWFVVNPNTRDRVELSFAMSGDGLCVARIEELERNVRIFDSLCNGSVDAISFGENRVAFSISNHGHEALTVLSDLVAFLRPGAYYEILVRQ